ncbi:MAG: UDP-N-acetylglucosamine 2-epimerase [Polaribacter sp.]
MKIGVLTSSRADYGIYKQLLSKLSKDDQFQLVIIVFGMHLLKEHGDTVKVIEKDNFGIIHKVLGMPNKDSEMEIAKGYGNLIINFSDYWSKNKFDYIIALGDRYEMSAAVQATIPFNLKIAHLHGGETTLGAIDNIYRHQITLASKAHFVSSDVFAEKVSNLIGSKLNIFNVGALSLDGFEYLILPEWSAVMKEFNIPTQNFTLVTFHPETVNVNKNKEYCKVIYKALEEISHNNHIVITMANADTMGSLYRETSKELKEKYPNKITLVESFGKENYFSAMKASKFLIGNTSSGILEAASYGKFVVNVGSRQLGRLQSGNVINVDFNKDQIIDAVEQIKIDGNFRGVNKYYKPNTANNIIEFLSNERL